MGPVFALLICGLAVCNAHSRIGLVPVEQELVFDYTSSVRVGTLEPALFASRYNIKAKLHVQGVDFSKGIASVRLTDITFRLNNGQVKPKPIEREHPKIPAENKWKHTEDVYLPIPADAEMLALPFHIRYDTNGKVRGTITDVTDKKWSINIKQSIASLLQLDYNEIVKGEEPSLVIPEETIYGQCNVTYSVNHGTKVTTVQKTQDPKFCGNGNSYVDENLVKIDSNRVYTLTHVDDFQEIQTITATGDIIVAPLDASATIQVVNVVQKLTRVATVRISNQIHVDNGYEVFGLAFLNPASKCNESDHIDITGERSPTNMAIIMPRLLDILDDTVHFMDTNHITLETPNWKNQHLFNKLLVLLRFLDLPSLEHCFAVLYEKKETRVERSKLDVFLQMIPKTGTRAAAIFTRNLLRKKKLSDGTAVKLIQEMPLHITCPTEQLLIELEDLLTIVTDVNSNLYRACILSFANLIDKTPTENSDLILKYVTFYIKQFKSTEDNKIQAVFVYGLANMAVESAVTYLKSIVTGSESATEEMRVRACLSIAKQMYHDDFRMLIYNLIISDRNLSTELRLAAYTIFVQFEREFSRFMDLYWLMSTETNELVYNFHYHTMKSLAEVTLPAFHKKAAIARLLLRISRKPIQDEIPHGLTIQGFVDEKSKYAGMVESVSIYTRASQTLFSRYRTNINGIDLSPTSVYVRVQESKSYLRKEKSTEDFAAEIVIMREEQIIACYFFDSTNIQLLPSIFFDIEAILADLNAKIIDINFPIQVERIIPTDFGVPVLFYDRLIVMPVLTVKINQNATFDKLENLKINLNVKLLMDGNLGLTVYNPINDLYHSVIKTKSVSLILPLTMETISLSPAVEIAIKLGEDEDVFGLQSYTYTDVLMYGSNCHGLLAEFNKDAQVSERVTKGDQYKKSHVLVDKELYNIGKKLQIAIYDCELPISEGTLVENFKSMINDFRHLDQIELQTALHKAQIRIYHQLLIAPGSASCGLALRLVPSVEIPVNYMKFAVKFAHDRNASDPLMFLSKFKGEFTLIADLIGPKDVPVRTTEIKGFVKLTEQHVFNEIAVDLVRKIPGQPDVMMLIDVNHRYETNGTLTKVKVSVGEREQLGVVDLRMKGVLSGEQKGISTDTKYTYEECLEEMSVSKKLLPVSWDCSKQVTTIRKYLMNITVSDVENRYVKKLIDGVHTWGKWYGMYWRHESQSGETGFGSMAHVEVDFPMASKEVNVVVETAAVKDTFTGLPVWKNFWSRLITPINRHYPISFNKFFETDTYTCVLDYNTLLNIDNRIVSVVPSFKWELYAGITEGNNTYEINVKRNYDSELPLELNIKIDEDTLLIYARPNKWIFQANNKKMYPQPSGYHFESFFDFMLNPNPELLILATHKYGIYLEFDGKTLRMHFAHEPYIPIDGLCLN